MGFRFKGVVFKGLDLGFKGLLINPQHKVAVITACAPSRPQSYMCHTRSSADLVSGDEVYYTFFYY